MATSIGLLSGRLALVTGNEIPLVLRSDYF